MKRKRPTIKQPTPEELLTWLLDLVQSKFYQGDAVQFTKDRRRLLEWVILYPASWLEERGVTVAADRYREIMRSIFFDAAAFGNTRAIAYRPAWLAKVVQSHFAMHGDEIYDEAKSMRNLVENALVITGKLTTGAPDAVRELASVRRLVKVASKAPKRPNNTPLKGQLNLL